MHPRSPCKFQTEATVSSYPALGIDNLSIIHSSMMDGHFNCVPHKYFSFPIKWFVATSSTVNVEMKQVLLHVHSSHVVICTRLIILIECNKLSIPNQNQPFATLSSFVSSSWIWMHKSFAFYLQIGLALCSTELYSKVSTPIMCMESVLHLVGLLLLLLSWFILNVSKTEEEETLEAFSECHHVGRDNCKPAEFLPGCWLSWIVGWNKATVWIVRGGTQKRRGTNEGLNVKPVQILFG